MTDQTIHENDVHAVIRRWFNNADPGDWLGVFENHDLGHPDIGRKVGFMFPVEQWGQVELGRTQAPDNAATGLGWRYLLVSMCKTADEGIAAWGDDE